MHRRTWSANELTDAPAIAGLAGGEGGGDNAPGAPRTVMAGGEGGGENVPGAPRTVMAGGEGGGGPPAAPRTVGTGR
jgi:hypothetical protein